MRYLVTGGAGFLGSHLCDHLIGSGHKVLCVDNYISGSKNNIRHLLSNNNFDWLEWDITNYLDVKNIDGIYHLASVTDPVKCKKNEDATLKANTNGTSHLLKLSKDLSIPLVFASSIRVLDQGAESSYLLGKRGGEALCQQFGAKVARMGNVYGPRMDKDDGRVIPTFIRKASKNEDLTIWGDGDEIDSFCYVSDITSGLISLMFSNYFGLVEFGSAKITTILYLANLIIKQLNSSSFIQILGNKSASIRKLADSSKARELLRWDPEINLAEGIRRTIQQYF